MVVAWLGGSALLSINVVTLRWARLVLGWVTVCGWGNHLGMQPATKVNSAFHPSWQVKQVPAVLAGVRRGKFICVGWQVTPCDSIWQVMHYSCEVGSHKVP